MRNSGERGGLGSRFVRSSVYMGGGAWLTYAINLFVNIGIARLLGPSEFGLYALVFSIGEFLLVVGALSMKESLINLREESQSFYDTAFAITAVQAIAAIGICTLIAPILATYRSTEAASFILVLGVSRALNFLAIPAMAQIERSLRYGQIAAIGIVTGSVPNFCALGLAWAGVGAWSLVLRDLLMGALQLVLMFLVSGYRFRFEVARDSARQLMEFARPMFWARTLDIAIERVDRVTVGVSFGDAVLGIYHQARYLAGIPTLAARPLFPLTFNLYSRLNSDPERLSRAFGIVNYLLARFVAMVGATFLIGSAEIVRLLLGEEWKDASPVLRALGIYAALLPAFWNAKQLLFARGKAIMNIRVRLMQAVIFLPGVFVSAALGDIIGVTVALTLGTLAALSLAFYYNRDLLTLSFVVDVAVPSIVCATSVGLFALARQFGIAESVPWPLIPVLAPAVYVLLSLAVEGRSLVRQFRFLLAQYRGGAAA